MQSNLSELAVFEYNYSIDNIEVLSKAVNKKEADVIPEENEAIPEIK